MFGLHDEVLTAQSKLDGCTQKWSEAFADFLVRFEDIALLTNYNDKALRWRMLKQIRSDLRNRLVDHGDIPETFAGVVKKLMRLDSAKQAFSEIGLGGARNWVTSNNTMPNSMSKTTNPTDTRQVNTRFNQRSTPNTTIATGRGAQEDNIGEVILEATSTSESNANNSPVQENSSTYPRVSQEEWNRRMRSGECGICGSKEHRYRDHFRKNGPKSITARGAFTEEYESENALYLEIEGFDEPVHIDDPVLEMMENDSGN